jgi:bisphosphoglycerate-independent phosphoglycerate mutase (AlkP superfamily)
LEIVLSESARMSTAAEARFRIQTPPDTNRAVKVIDLDSATDRDIKRLIAEIDGADLVLMLVSAGGNAEAAATIGEACSARRVMTHTVIVRAASATDEALSKTLAQVRPWSLMVVVVNDDDYVDDILKSFR